MFNFLSLSRSLSPLFLSFSHCLDEYIQPIRSSRRHKLFLIQHKESKKNYTWKIYPPTKENEIRLEREMKLSEEVKGEGVVRAVDLFLFEGQFYIVRDYYKKGTLEDEIERLRKEKNSLPLPVSLSFFFFFSHSFPFLSFLFSSLLLSLPFVDLRCSSTML